MKKIYRFYVDMGRMGELDGVFLADDSDIKNIIGKEVYFGEILGKYSDISLIMKDDMFSMLSENSDHINTFEELYLDIGINPFNYEYDIYQ